MWDLLSAAAVRMRRRRHRKKCRVHVLVTVSEREVASPNKANADRFAANVLPVIEQIKASGRHVIACDRQSAQRARRCPRLAAASGRRCR